MKQLVELKAQAEKLSAEADAIKARIARLERPRGATSPATKASPGPASHAAGTTPAEKPGTETGDGKNGPVKSEQTGTAQSKLDDFLDTPDSPAAAILGVTPQKIVRPSDAKMLVGSVLNGIDEQGNFQTGLAIDFAPYKLFPQRVRDDGENLGSVFTNSHYFADVASRTQLSFVTAKGTTDTDKAVRLALGIQVTLMDEPDPATRANKVLHERVAMPSKFLQQLGLPLEEAKGLAGSLPVSAWHYNSSWSVGAAQALISQDGGSAHFRSDGYAAYSTYSYGFEGIEKAPMMSALGLSMQRYNQLLFEVQYRDNNSVPDTKEKGAFVDEDSIKLGLRFRFGDSDLNASFDGSFKEEKASGGAYKPAYSIAFDVEKKLFDSGTYLTLSLGKEFDNVDGNNPVLVLGGVKVGFSPSGAKAN